jgi:hypothetical protein
MQRVCAQPSGRRRATRTGEGARAALCAGTAPSVVRFSAATDGKATASDRGYMYTPPLTRMTWPVT